MYISEITMQGFKSFAKKEKIKFGKGITVIVGPNGCGKTNIVDAIRWVLGEQKYSVLRSSKMGDVIFNGAEGHKPLSVSEVFLTVQNNRGLLPVEYTDIEIGRRVYRDGESEYFINKTPCRLKDVHDLFVDTGMGSDAYSVIELKMIEQILSDASDDRKRMFEEAAGINKYKQQRKSSLKKFDSVQKDLERVDDIIQEIENNVHSLELHLKRFKRHEKLSNELKEKDISLAYVKLHSLKSNIIPLEKLVNEAKDLSEKKSNQSSIFLKDLNDKKREYKIKLKEVNVIEDSINEKLEERESLQNNVIISSERLYSSDNNLKRLASEKILNAKKIENLRSEIKNKMIDIDALVPTINKERDSYKAKKIEFESIENTFKNAQKDLENIQNFKWEKSRKMEMDLSLIDRTSTLIKEKNIEKKSSEEKLYNLKNEINNLKNEQELLTKEKNNNQKKVDILKLESSNLIKKLNESENMLSEISMKEVSVKSKVESIENQINFYQNLIEQGEGFFEGTRHILKNRNDFPGVIGAISDLFENIDDYEQAFVSYLGDRIKFLVVKNRKSASDILKIAKSLKLGSLIMIPLEELNTGLKNKNIAPKKNGIIGKGVDLCGIAKKYEPLAHYLLGNLLIVDDLSNFINDKDLKNWDLVDLHGNFVDRNFLFKHSKKEKNKGMLARKKRLADLNVDLSKYRLKLNENSDKRTKISASIDNLKEDLDNINSEEEKAFVELQELEKTIIKNHYSQSQILENKNELQSQLNEFEKVIKDSSKALINLEKNQIKLKDEYSSVEEKFIKSNQYLSSVEKEKNDFQNKIQDIRIELINIENNKDNIEFKIRVSEETIKEIELRNEEIKKELSDTKTLKIDLEKSINNSEKNLEMLNGNIAKEKSIFKLKKELVDETYAEIEDLQDKVFNEQKFRESLIEEMKINELKIADINQSINVLKERIRDRYSQEIPNEMIVDEDVDDLEFRIERIEKSIENIGPINMAVKDEYDEELKRLNIFLEQREDLIKSEDHLRATLLKIDKVAREKFEKTFSQIKLNFESLFKLFFDGGQASISLIGDPDPLEAEIEIHAQPPGKKNQSLRMLSAGEKSLTAIALLFAIYKFKPSPYCILDEIDAPLDDANVEKFKRVLKKFSDDTQFIVVTHNKLTMESASFLYGVTMEQKGISKLVSVKFDKFAKS